MFFILVGRLSQIARTGPVRFPALDFSGPVAAASTTLKMYDMERPLFKRSRHKESIP